MYPKETTKLPAKLPEKHPSIHGNVVSFRMVTIGMIAVEGSEPIIHLKLLL